MTSVSLGGPGKHYINCVLLPFDFHIICNFVRHQLSAYYHLLRFQSYSHCSEICHSDGLQFASLGSTLGFVLFYWREKLRHLYQLLHTCCHFVLFALSSRVTNSTSFSGAHCKGFKGFPSDLPSPSTTPISNSLQTDFINIFQRCFPTDCNTPDNIFNTLFTHNPSHLHIATTNMSSTTSSPLPMLTPSPTTPLLPTLIVLPPSPATSYYNTIYNGNSTKDHASQRSCDCTQIHIVATKGASTLF